MNEDTQKNRTIARLVDAMTAAGAHPLTIKEVIQSHLEKHHEKAPTREVINGAADSI